MLIHIYKYSLSSAVRTEGSSRARGVREGEGERNTLATPEDPATA
jgi:hypothetical protein